MKARLVNEKFIEDSDPIHDMGIGLVGRMLYMPEGYELSEHNKFYKRYKTNKDNNHGSTFKVLKAKMIKDDLIEATIEEIFEDGVRRFVYSDVWITPKQFSMFAKKYQNLKK